MIRKVFEEGDSVLGPTIVRGSLNFLDGPIPIINKYLFTSSSSYATDLKRVGPCEVYADIPSWISEDSLFFPILVDIEHNVGEKGNAIIFAGTVIGLMVKEEQ